MFNHVQSHHSKQFNRSPAPSGSGVSSVLQGPWSIAASAMTATSKPRTAILLLFFQYFSPTGENVITLTAATIRIISVTTPTEPGMIRISRLPTRMDNLFFCGVRCLNVCETSNFKTPRNLVFKFGRLQLWEPQLSKTWIITISFTTSFTISFTISL